MFKSVSFDEVKVGDEVEIQEFFLDLDTLLRGKVVDVESTAIQVGGPGHYRIVMKEVEGRTVLNIRTEQPPPPSKPGSIVKYYDLDFLRYATAWVEAGGLWYDTATGTPVDLKLCDWTVLFDAEKDA